MKKNHKVLSDLVVKFQLSQRKSYNRLDFSTLKEKIGAGRGIKLEMALLPG